MSQGIGRPEERERDGGTVSQWSTQDTHLLSSIVYGTVGCAQSNYNSNIKGHLLQVTMTSTLIMKILKYCNVYKNVAQRHTVSQRCWKNGPSRQWRVAINLQFVRSTVLVKH